MSPGFRCRLAFRRRPDSRALVFKEKRNRSIRFLRQHPMLERCPDPVVAAWPHVQSKDVSSFSNNSRNISVFSVAGPSVQMILDLAPSPKGLSLARKARRF